MPMSIHERIAHLQSRVERGRGDVAGMAARASGENGLLQGAVSNAMNLQADIVELCTLREVVGGRYGVVGR